MRFIIAGVSIVFHDKLNVTSIIGRQNAPKFMGESLNCSQSLMAFIQVHNVRLNSMRMLPVAELLHPSPTRKPQECCVRAAGAAWLTNMSRETM